MKKKSFIVITALLIMAMFAACATSTGSAAPDYGNEVGRTDLDGKGTVDTAPQVMPDPMPATDASKGADYVSSESGNMVTLTVDPNRKLIRTGHIELETLTFDQTIADLNAMLSDFGGFVESSSISGMNTYDSRTKQLRFASVTVRIPSEHFDAFMNGSSALGNVLLQSTGSSDVTDTYFDIEARLKSQQMMEERLLDLLSKSDNISDIVSLEQALADVRYQIENLTGTLRKYDSLIDYSTFTLSIQEVVQITEVEEPEPDPITLPERLWDSLKNSFKAISEGSEDVLVFLVGALPFIVIFGIIIVIVFVVVIVPMRRSRRGKAASLPAQTPGAQGPEKKD